MQGLISIEKVSFSRRCDIKTTKNICFFGFNVVFRHLRSYRDGASLTNVLPHMPQTQDMTPPPPPSQYTDTVPICRCTIGIHRRGTSHWNTQLPILMSWVRPDREISFPDLPQTPANAHLYDAGMVVVSRKHNEMQRATRTLLFQKSEFLKHTVAARLK